MTRRFLVFIFSILVGLYGQPKLFAQEILWNKNYQTVPDRPEQAFDHLVRLPSGNLMGFGVSNKTTTLWVSPNGTPVELPHPDLYKLNQNGDTIWTKSLNETVNTTVGFVYFENKLIVSFRANVINQPAIIGSPLVLMVLDTNGIELYRNYNMETILPEQRIPVGMYFENLNEIYFYGYVLNANMFPPLGGAWYLHKFRLGGTQTEWVKYYTPGYTQSWNMHLERLADKRFVFSGSAGPRVAFWVTDSVGNHTVGDVKFPFAENYNGFCSNGRVMMHPNGGYVCFASQEFNTPGIIPNYHLRLFNSNDSLLWTRVYRDATGSSTMNKINQDGSIIHYNTYKDRSKPDSLFHQFEKLDINGNQAWQIRFGNRTNQNTWSPRAVSYLEDESAIFGGSFRVSSTGRVFNVRKISNIGRPFDPANPVSLPREELVNTTNNYTLHPNPANERVFVKGLEGSFGYQILNSLGQIMQTGNSEGEISLSKLPAGTYLLRTNQNNQTPTQRFVKL